MTISSLEYIDQYFQGIPAPEEARAFEQRLVGDPAFAEEVAFYLSARQVLKEQWAAEKKSKFRELYEHNSPVQSRQTILHRLWPYMAAAAIVTGLILSWYLFIKPPDLSRLAENYIHQNFTTLGVTMGTSEDRLQQGVRLYNDGKLKQALQEFEKIVNLDTSNYSAKKYAGITSLRLQQYDRALHYFILLKDQPNLYANPGAFLQATTLLKRNLPGDKHTAKALLEQVVQNDLEGRETAEQWLKKW